MKAVFFDLDGTILDRKKSLSDFVEWQVNELLKHDVIDKKLFIKRFIELDANGLIWKDKVYESLIEEFDIRNWTVSELLSSYESDFSAFSKPIEGAIEAIHEIKDMGLKIGLISNGRTPFQERNLDALGISELFDTIVVSEAVGLRKPDLEIFKFACNKINVDPSDSIFIGDSIESDIHGANIAGVTSIFIPNIETKNCKEADFVLTHFKKLQYLITRIMKDGTGNTHE